MKNLASGKMALAALSLTLVFLASGCALSGRAGDENFSWQDEVLLASECGQDGLPCCPDDDQPCRYGQVCCTDPSGSSRNRCADECACGGLGQFCCAGGDSCGDGLACADGDCVACGGPGEPCCESGTVCQGELYCHETTCMECGLPDQPCCTSGIECREDGAGEGERTGCLYGVCRYCGTEGRPACAADPYCDSGHLLNNSYCLACGGFNQPCCATDGESGEACDTEKGLACELGFCAKE